MRPFVTCVLGSAFALLLCGSPLRAIPTKADPTDVASSRPDQDEEPDGLTNQEEAEAGTFPYNAYSDSDIDPDGLDGWAREPALSPPRLPNVQYAVIDLEQGEPQTGNYPYILGLGDDNTVLFSDEHFGHTWNPKYGIIPLSFWPNSISRSGQYVCGDGDRDFNDPQRNTSFYLMDVWSGAAPTAFAPWTKYGFPSLGGDADPLQDGEEAYAVTVNSSGTTLGYFADQRTQKYIQRPPRTNFFSWYGVAGTGLNFTTGQYLNAMSWTAVKSIITYPADETLPGVIRYENPGENGRIFIPHQIADDGTIVGQVGGDFTALDTLGHNPTHSFLDVAKTAAVQLVSSSTAQELPLPGGTGEESEATALNSSSPKRGIIGSYYNDNNSGEANLWLFSEVESPCSCPIARDSDGEPVTLERHAYDINDRFQITTDVGLVHNGRLTTPKIAGSDWKNPWAQYINNSGIIVGYADYSGTDPNITAGSHRVMLLPVQIGSRKQGMTTAPETGLLVKKGEVLEVALAPQFFDTEDNFETLITWQQRQLKGDGTYTEWSNISAQATGAKFEHTTAAGGIFQIKAIITNGGEHKYMRKIDAPHAKNGSGVYNEKLRKDQPDFIGVADNAAQVAVRDQSLSLLGSTAYAKSAAITVGYGVDPTLDFKGAWKCNIFVFSMSNAAGVSVPTKSWRDYRFGIPPYVDRAVPPGANDWYSSSYSIPSWTWAAASTLPQPGFAAIHQHVNDAVAGGAHIGILDYDGTWISAGSATVNKSIHVSDGDYQPTNYRKP